MNKTQKIISSGIISLVIGYFGYFLFISIKYSHHVELNNYKRYLWLFKDSTKNDIDTFFFAGFIRNNDILYKYSYKNSNVFIWEFKDLSFLNLNRVYLVQDVNLMGLKFSSREVLNKKNSPEIHIKYGFTFNNSMIVNLDNYSKVESTFEKINYKGFCGVLNKISFSNEVGHQILFDYGNTPQHVLFLLYKGHGSFFVIMINSEKPFDEDIITILNLK